MSLILSLRVKINGVETGCICVKVNSSVILMDSLLFHITWLCDVVFETFTLSYNWIR